MRIRRFTTAESPAGVRVQTDDVLDSSTIEGTDVIDIWGFDKVPGLPVRPEDVLGEYRRMGAFGPLGGLRADIIVLPSAPGDEPPDLSEALGRIHLGTGAGMAPGKEGGGMHRTDSIDLVAVLDGETNVAYPGEGGGEHEITIRAGDFLTHNGVFHRWHNRSGRICTLLCISVAAERSES